jgi:hypothetical protein
VPEPAASWHELQTFATLAKALCLACAPLLLGVDVPEGGLAWQEVQLVVVSGVPPAWQAAVVQDLTGVEVAVAL